MSSEINHGGRAHALLSASGSERWINCPASPRLEENFPEESSDFAKEGTLAHEMAELMLRVDLKLMPMADYRKAIAVLKASEYHYTGMEDDVMPYVRYVKEQFNEAKRYNPLAKILLEQKLDLTKYVEGGFGTADCVIVSSANIEVIDLKFGKGKLVNAEGNPQLKYYALGALDLFQETTGWHVKATIVQPRIDNIQSAGMTAQALRKWGEEVLKPKATEAYNGDGEQKAGDWCQFCKARAKCRTLYDLGMDVAKRDFAEFADKRLISDDELLKAYESADFIKKWLEEVKSTVLREAVAGKEFKGYKLVEGRSTRQWSDEAQAMKVLEENLYEPHEFTNSKIKGLGDLEKLLKKANFEKLLGHLIVKPAGAPTLVSENDKRPTFGESQVKKDFADFDDLN